MKRKSVTCISLLFIGCGISYFCFDKYDNIKDLNNNELLMMEYFERIDNDSSSEEVVVSTNNSNKTSFNKVIKKEKEEYISILQIPKINFKRGLYKQDSPENELDKNIIFLDSSDMPDKENSRVIIVGHSGAPSNAYFKYLYKLSLKDEIYLFYNNIKYVYKVSDIYEIKKNGTLALESNKENKTLTLVTCKGQDKQIVIVSTLIKEEKL